MTSTVPPSGTIACTRISRGRFQSASLSDTMQCMQSPGLNLSFIGDTCLHSWNAYHPSCTQPLASVYLMRGICGIGSVFGKSPSFTLTTSAILRFQALAGSSDAADVRMPQCRHSTIRHDLKWISRGSPPQNGHGFSSSSLIIAPTPFRSFRSGAAGPRQGRP